MYGLWTLNTRLADSSRWRKAISPGATAAWTDGAILFGCGLAAAAATSAGALELRLPGHAILRGTLPLILGLSLAPRRSAGAVMSVAAGVGFAALQSAGMGRANPAALTGVLCLGPILDLAVARPARGWMLYVQFAAAGAMANLATFAVRMLQGGAVVAAGGGRGFGGGGGRGLGGGGGRGLGGRGAGRAAIHEFWPQALASFLIFGAVAGLICGVLWFRARPAAEKDDLP